jgi:hypothetical protein
MLCPALAAELVTRREALLALAALHHWRHHEQQQEPAVETERAEAKRTSLVDRQLPWTKSSSRCTA